MTKPIWASALLRTAEQLAGVGAGRGRPALTDLRRATSTAYYAIFHQILRHGAIDFLPSGAEPEVASVARWFTHTGVLGAAGLVLDADTVTAGLGQVKRQSLEGVMAIRTSAGGAVPRDLVVVADAFQSLQDARHKADYDGNYDPVRAVTINHVDDARAAVEATWRLWNEGSRVSEEAARANDAYRTFLPLAMLRSGGPRAR